ncbi:MAG TPA: hypothetical protein VFX70_04810 [Mycobacteriales bacterium]|nr:hypothetical protein [Mycobacteriales bacterium]
MARFVGRSQELRVLERELARVSAAGDDRPGRCLLVRGRRRVGKSRLIETFVGRSGVASLYSTATGAPKTELSRFRRDAAESSLPARDLLAAGHPADSRRATPCGCSPPPCPTTRRALWSWTNCRT